jgi:hypothetical protein
MFTMRSSEWCIVCVISLLPFPKMIGCKRWSVISQTDCVEALAKNGGNHAASVDHFVSWMRALSGGGRASHSVGMPFRTARACRESERILRYCSLVGLNAPRIDLTSMRDAVYCRGGRFRRVIGSRNVLVARGVRGGRCALGAARSFLAARLVLVIFIACGAFLLFPFTDIVSVVVPLLLTS